MSDQSSEPKQPAPQALSPDATKKPFDWGPLGTILALLSMAFAVGIWTQTGAFHRQSMDGRIEEVGGLPGGGAIWHHSGVGPHHPGCFGQAYGQLHPLPKGWAICNGISGTPALTPANS